MPGRVPSPVSVGWPGYEVSAFTFNIVGRLADRVFQLSAEIPLQGKKPQTWFQFISCSVSGSAEVPGHRRCAPLAGVCPEHRLAPREDMGILCAPQGPREETGRERREGRVCWPTPGLQSNVVRCQLGQALALAVGKHSRI